MERTNLYNPGFVGSQFHWWLGQVADSSTWRDNQTNKSYDKPEDIPGWGYRYKVRIMGIHDAGEAIIPSDQLPWAQVMYPITAGGGQGGSFQTPGIKEGMFVFGFFLDGSDEGVPVIMGVLGNNAKTVIKEISTEENRASDFGAKSAFRDDDSITCPDSCLALQTQSSGASEDVDGTNRNNAGTKKQEKIYNEEIPLDCVKHGNPMTSMATHMSNFQKEYQGLMEQLNSYGSAAAGKNTVNSIIKNDNGEEINQKIEDLISKTSNLGAKSLSTPLVNTEKFLSTKINNITRSIDDATSIFDRLDNFQANIEAQNKLTCVFNKIKGDLARLIAAGIKKSLARKQNQTPQNNNQNRPVGANSNLIPPIPPEGFYTPSNPCETEDLIADVFSEVMGDIKSTYQSALEPIAAGSGTSSQGRLANPLSQENVLANLENGKLFGGLGAALGASIGINASQSGAISSALQAGNYAAALTSLVDFSGSNTALGGLASAIQSANSGDLVGAFSGLSGPLGIDSKLMGAVGGALGAINGGNIAGLTNELANLGGLAPNILTDVLGGRLPLSGIDIGGFGALGGLDFDMALATTFMSTASAFLECDPPPKCDYSDTHTLGGGAQKKDDSKSNSVNVTNAMEKLDELSDNKRGSAFAAGKALNNRIKEGIESTGIPSNLPEGSFGISAAGREQALTNRINAASRITNIPSGDDLPAGSFGISEEVRIEQRVEQLTGIPANLPEGSFGITSKKKFSVPSTSTSQNEEMIEFERERQELLNLRNQEQTTTQTYTSYTDSSGATQIFKGTKEELQNIIEESPYTKRYPLKIKEFEVKTPVKNKNYNRYTGSDGNQYLLGNNGSLAVFNRSTNPRFRKRLVNIMNITRKAAGLPPLRPTEAQINDPNFKLE